MRKKSVAVLDYGIGNLKSVVSAIEYIGSSAFCSSSIDDFTHTDALIIPGVGAFQHGMNAIRKHNFDHFVASYQLSGRPILGICLGMQLLLSDSSEFGLAEGLNIIPGKVRKLTDDDFGGSTLKLPHVGWSTLKFKTDRTEIEDKFLLNISEEDYFYFVHSFAAQTSPQNSLAHTSYRAVKFTSIISNENVIGVQFHPEKSGEIGLTMLSNFINL